MTPTNLHRFIVFTACCTFVLLIAGALVTSNDAGLAVPDWPLSYGSFLPPMVGGILYEHGHRMIAAFVGFLAIVVAVWAWRREPRAWVRRLAMGALGLVVAQGILGGITVLLYLPTVVSVAHATLAQLFFCTIVTLGLVTGFWWQSELPEFSVARERARGWPETGSLGVAASLSVLLQLILGAAFRHKGVGIWPHLVGAAVVTVMIVWLAAALLRRYPGLPRLRSGARFLMLLLGVQLLLGASSYWAVWSAREAPQPVPFEVLITVTHVVVGALTLAATLWVTLCSFRVIRGGSQISARDLSAAIASSNELVLTTTTSASVSGIEQRMRPT